MNGRPPRSSWPAGARASRCFAVAVCSGLTWWRAVSVRPWSNATWSSRSERCSRRFSAAAGEQKVRVEKQSRGEADCELDGKGRIGGRDVALDRPRDHEQWRQPGEACDCPPRGYDQRVAPLAIAGRGEGRAHHQPPGALRDHDRERQDAMADDDLEEPATHAIGLREPEQPAQADAIGEQDVDHREAEEDAEGERDHRHVDVVDHDQPGYLDSKFGRDVGPELVVMNPVDQLWRRDSIRRIGIGQHHEVADDRGHEQECGRSHDVRPRLAVRGRESLGVERAYPPPHLPSAAVHNPVAAGHQPVEISVHRVAGPVALRAGEVGGGATVERGHGEDLGGSEAVELAGPGASDQVLQAASLLFPPPHGSFMVVFGYFWISEALFSGQTLGKRAFRLRVVGDRGEPLTWVQAGVRNVIRIVDFLPYGYGVGVVVLFINGRGKRLGDLAAGTIVVKDSDHVWLWQLGRPATAAPPQPPPPPPPGVASQYPAAPPPPPPGQ